MNIVVLGGGESGFGAAFLAKKQGHQVFVSDFGNIADSYAKKMVESDIEFEEGQHTSEIIFKADVIVKSPGIPNTVPVITKAKEKGIEVISEIEWAYRHINGGKIIAITGSNGKTTTTSLMYDVLCNYSNSVCLAGNIGESLSYKVALNSYDYYAIELSSFQLDDIVTFKPDVAIILNISADHLDRYDWNIDNYAQSKMNIAKNMTPSDHLIVWEEDELIQKYLDVEKVSSHSFSSEGNLFCQGRIEKEHLIIRESADWDFNLESLSLQGQHNYMNMMAVGLASQILKIDKESVQSAFTNFKSVEHRLEFVKTVEGVQYINDTKATNVDAVYYALDTFSQPIVWIAGGIDKGNDYSLIENLVQDKVKLLICLGDNKDNLIASFEGKVPMVFATSMEEAVTLAKSSAVTEDVVLLSPACSSFDMFNNYAHRGVVFKECVHKLM